VSAILDVPVDAQRLAWLQGQVSANRFLPAPPPELMLCGDGDFRAIGAEFLGYFARLAGLGADERVLDVGCGVGRMAVPLTQYLTQRARYVGLDVAQSGIAWCARTITPAYPNFTFEHLDLHHPIYNPGGGLDAGRARLPVADAQFDLVLLVSVLTHLDTASVLAYAAEIARVLAPGGRLFATTFLMNPPAREALRRGEGRLAFDPDAAGPEYYADPAAPLAAIAFDEDHLVEKFLRFGLRRRGPVLYGHWSGRPSPVFQDINVFERDPG
jgi:SAM-dependent methyltransferase